MNWSSSAADEGCREPVLTRQRYKAGGDKDPKSSDLIFQILYRL